MDKVVPRVGNGEKNALDGEGSEGDQGARLFRGIARGGGYQDVDLIDGSFLSLDEHCDRGGTLIFKYHSLAAVGIQSTQQERREKFEEAKRVVKSFTWKREI